MIKDRDAVIIAAELLDGIPTAEFAWGISSLGGMYDDLAKDHPKSFGWFTDPEYNIGDILHHKTEKYLIVVALYPDIRLIVMDKLWRTIYD